MGYRRRRWAYTSDWTSEELQMVLEQLWIIGGGEAPFLPDLGV